MHQPAWGGRARRLQLSPHPVRGGFRLQIRRTGRLGRRTTLPPSARGMPRARWTRTARENGRGARLCPVPSRLYTIVVDSREPRRLADFWAAVLDFRILYDAPDEVGVARDDDTYPGLIFVLVPDHKVVKNRLHIDLNPDDRDREVARLERLGATRADVGQGPEVTWVVMRDPEGNEFCVLGPREGGL